MQYLRMVHSLQEGGVRVCGDAVLRYFLVRYCGNFNFKVRYCGFTGLSGLRFLLILGRGNR